MTESRSCQNCKNVFEIEQEDFDFYEKIKVPPPTWCPECRLQRRASWRTDISLFRRADSRNNKEIFSMYSASSPVVVWSREDWFSDSWDPLDFGQEYNWNKPFFEQFLNLMRRVPWPSLAVDSNVDSPYANNASALKNCYLVFGSGYSEDSMYSFGLSKSRSCMDCSYALASDSNYWTVFNRNCYRAFYSDHCRDSSDIYFCRNCVSVTNCYGCVNLRNKSHCIFNEQVTPEEYESFVNSTNLGSWDSVQKWWKESRSNWAKYPVKYQWGSNILSSSGQYLNNCKNVNNSYYVDDGENVKYSQFLYLGPTKDCYDYFRFSDKTELVYESMGSGTSCYNMRFCFHCFTSCSNLTYATNCFSCNNLFGCASLKKKEYCILNKQYSKNEYEELVPRIIQHMNDVPYVDKLGRTYKFGEFFPPEFSAYGYNESIAPEFFPLTKQEAISAGFRWVESAERNNEPTLMNGNIPDRISDIHDSITNEKIECSHSGRCGHPCSVAFRILPTELEFYRRNNIPLPRLCFACRHHERLKTRLGVKLYDRQCMCGGDQNTIYKNQAEHFHGSAPCSESFKTSHSSEAREIVYCERCYNAETA